jgi:transposase-like protein
MKDYNTKGMELPSEEERRSFVEDELRRRTREWIVEMVNEELDIALGIGRYERGEGRRGYRKGHRKRSFTTRNGRHEVFFPRGEFFEPDSDTGQKEWNSRLIPRYSRRTDEVEEALVATYLCGVNTRKVKVSLGPLLEGAALSRSTVSRLVSRLKEHFEAWEKRDLSGQDIAVLFLDGFRLKIRIGGKVESVPVLCVIGVDTDGNKELLVLKIRTSESIAAWQSVTEDLVKRGVRAPVLAVIDGNDGLHAAVKDSWPWVDIQRCTKHKLENLSSHSPKRLYEEIKTDYHSIVYADNEQEARRAWERFERRWQKDCPGVVKSLQEGGDELLTFYRYPRSMWTSLRTTNRIERLNEEFRRRVKTQGSLPNSDAALILLYGLFAAGVINLQRINGWMDLPKVVFEKRSMFNLLNTEKTVEEAA